MSKPKTDNTNLSVKVELRQEAIDKIAKKDVAVMDAYAGSQIIWDTLMRNNPHKNFTYYPIDIKAKYAINCDNMKILPNITLDKFDIIDLDAYGIPYAQLKLVLGKKFQGFIAITWIQSNMGSVPKTLVHDLGFGDNYQMSTTLWGKAITLDRVIAFLGINPKKVRVMRSSRKSYCLIDNRSSSDFI